MTLISSQIEIIRACEPLYIGGFMSHMNPDGGSTAPCECINLTLAEFKEVFVHPILPICPLPSVQSQIFLPLKRIF
jgi:hypothetical protein